MNDRRSGPVPVSREVFRALFSPCPPFLSEQVDEVALRCSVPGSFFKCYAIPGSPWRNGRSCSVSLELREITAGGMISQGSIVGLGDRRIGKTCLSFLPTWGIIFHVRALLKCGLENHQGKIVRWASWGSSPPMRSQAA